MEFAHFVDAHKTPGGLVGPPELTSEPNQPVSVPDQLLGLGEPTANFDSVADATLGELADYRSVVGQRGFRDGERVEMGAQILEELRTGRRNAI